LRFVDPTGMDDEESRPPLFAYDDAGSEMRRGFDSWAEGLSTAWRLEYFERTWMDQGEPTLEEVREAMVGIYGPGAMSISQDGLEMIARFEGLSLTQYKDIAGNLTIGYGHLVQAGEDFSAGITQAQALQLLLTDVRVAIGAVNSVIAGMGGCWNDFFQWEVDAMVSLAYNIGAGAFKNSTLARNIRTGEPVTEVNFSAYNRAGGQVSRGLVNRRAAEWRVFSTGVYK